MKEREREGEREREREGERERVQRTSNSWLVLRAVLSEASILHSFKWNSSVSVASWRLAWEDRQRYHSCNLNIKHLLLLLHVYIYSCI